MQTFKILQHLKPLKTLFETMEFVKTLNLSQINTLINEIGLNKWIHKNSSPISSQVEINFHQRVLAEIANLKNNYTFPPEVDAYGLDIYKEYFNGTEETFVKTKLLSLGAYQLLIEVDDQHSIYVSPTCLTLIEYDNGRIIKRQGSYEKLKFYMEHLFFDMNNKQGVKIHRVRLNQSALAKAS